MPLALEAPEQTLVRKTLGSPRWWFGMKQREVVLPAPPLSVTILIPAYNEEASIADTIRSAQEQTYPVSKIIVIDDCSTDRTNEIARAMGVTVLRPETNQGTKAQAQNLALAQVTSDIVATIDADTVLRPNAIEEVLKYFNDPRTGAACGFVIPQKSKTLWELGRYLEYLFAFTIIKGTQEHYASILVASGCFTLFRTSILKGYGGFDRRTMAEDMDITWRMIADGWLVRFAPKALCEVVDPPTLKIFGAQLTRWSHGFLQNIKVRTYDASRPRFKWRPLDLFRVNKRLAAVAYFYLIWQLLGPFWIPVMVYYLTLAPREWAIGLVGLYGAVVWVPAIVQCVRFKKPVSLVFKSIVPFFVIQFVNIYYFAKALYKEIRGETVHIWVKGH